MLAESEVSEFHAPVRTQQDVLWADVAVKHPVRVRMCQRRRDCRRDVDDDGVSGGDALTGRGCDGGTKVESIDVLHHEAVAEVSLPLNDVPVRTEHP